MADPYTEDGEPVYSDAAYLYHLASLVMRIPGMYGVDQGDYERLRRMAYAIDPNEPAPTDEN